MVAVLEGLRSQTGEGGMTAVFHYLIGRGERELRCPWPDSKTRAESLEGSQGRWVPCELRDSSKSVLNPNLWDAYSLAFHRGLAAAGVATRYLCSIKQGDLSLKAVKV